MPAGLVTLFLGLILMALAFVPGSAVWKTLHDALFGVFGCGSFVVGAPEFVAGSRYPELAPQVEPYLAKGYRVLLFAACDSQPDPMTGFRRQGCISLH